MGLVPHSLKMIQAYIAPVGGFAGLRMMELGDQQMYCHGNVPEGSAAKSFFEQLGVQHTSIDLNGELGAIALDLSQPIRREEWNGQFDMVTDFGTTEHVGRELVNLYNCRENCHRFCRPGGVMIFMNPKKGNWPGHGYHYFTKEHYEKLALAAGYRVLEISEYPTLGNSTDGWQIHAAFIRGDGDFIPFEAYAEICKDTVFPK